MVRDCCLIREDAEEILNLAIKAAKISGKILVREFGKLRQHQIDLKGRGDYVTEIDHQSEETIIRIIKNRFPDHGICAEESGSDRGSAPFLWFIDPLDGTANYVHQIPFFAISIGVSYRREPFAGVVYIPLSGELFSVIKGKGAFLNGKPIYVSSKKELSKAMLASGFPWRSKIHLDNYLTSFKELFILSSGVRRMGVASIDLAYTACGRFDGFWEMKLKSHDIAAGILLVKEAGGIVTDFKGEASYLTNGNVIAANPTIHQELLFSIKKHLSSIE